MTTLDLVIFFGSLFGVMVLGLWVGRKEEDSEDYFLAGKKTKWWGVAGSIFGSNVSANHIVGMLGVGYAVGFAQSHFEITAIAGLLLLCYGFLPVYRKLGVFTLSEYLAKRYDDKCRVAYAAIMVFIMVFVLMVPGFYIGSRTLNVLLQEGQTAVAVAHVAEDGGIDRVEVKGKGSGYDAAPVATVPPPEWDGFDQGSAAELDVEIVDGEITAIQVVNRGAGYGSGKGVAGTVPIVIKGGAEDGLNPGDISPYWYKVGILLMMVVTGAYVIFGGIKAVIFTDVIQSVLMVVAAVVVASMTLSLPEVGGWSGMLEKDAAGKGLMHLYLPTTHPVLPWTGVLTGLMVLHFYYWGANQFIVQRALTTRTDAEARFGILFAGFFKLLIPFVSIGAGIAAFYVFTEKGVQADQDTAFTALLKTVVAPVGGGLVGLIAAGMVGAILSSVDSLLNSSSAIMTIDFYKRFVNPVASEKKLVAVGRIWIVVFLGLAAWAAIFAMDPNSKDSFFMHVASYQSKLIAGVVVAFGLGMFWKRATAPGALAAIIGGVIFSFGIVWLYDVWIGASDSEFATEVKAVFGAKLAFMHAVAISFVLSLVLHVVISLMTQPDAEKAKMNWTDVVADGKPVVRGFAVLFGIALIVYAVLAILVNGKSMEPGTAGWIGAVTTFVVFAIGAFAASRREGIPLIKNDRFFAGLLASCAVFMMFKFW